jgi:DNA adenine methylase
MGSKTEVEYLPGYLARVAYLLRKASLRTVDFEAAIDQTKKGDLLFVDPPYTVMHNNNNFVKYNAHLFSWSDQQRLASAVKRAAARGAHVILSNADHQSVRQLYDGFGRHLRLSRSTVLAAGSAHRCETTELVVTTLP